MLHRITAQLGATEHDRGALSEAVQGYYRAAGIEPPPGLPAEHWGGILVAWAALGDGIAPPAQPDNPLAWTMWGQALHDPQPGAVVVITDGMGRHALEVGMVSRVVGRKVHVAGVHGGVVQVVAVPIERVICARRPPPPGQSILPPPAVHTAMPLPQQQAALPAPSREATDIPFDPVLPPQPQPATADNIDMELLLRVVKTKFSELDGQIERLKDLQQHAIVSVKLKDGTHD